MNTLEKAKNILLKNKKVTIQEKGNPYDEWVIYLVPNGIKWENINHGENGQIYDLSEFFNSPGFESNLIIVE